MALINFKKGLLASLPSTYAEGTFYITTDERAIYLDVANDKRIRLGDFQEFADLATLEANTNPSTSALYYIANGNILAKWDGNKYVQINVQKTLAELGGVSKATFDELADKVNTLEVTGGQANVIETVKVNGVVLPVTDKAVDVTVPTGALASKNSVSKDDLVADFKAEIEGKLDAADVTGDLLTHNASEFAAALHSHAISEVTGLQNALAGKQDVIPANTYDTYGAAAQALADAKAYADENDADTKYGITYDSANKKIKLVEGGSEVEIDASAFIKDGMINTVTINENDDLIITFNTDAGKENIVLPLDQLVDIYTGIEGDRVKVTVSSDNKISADLVAGSISKNYLDTAVQASLSKADSALQAHQDISHLATESDLTLAENRITALEEIDHEHTNKALLDTYTQTEANLADAVLKKHEHANKAVLDGITAEKVTAWGAAEQNAKDYADTEVAKDRARLAAVEAALTWGTF